ncbi:MAG: transketolase family protein [Prevotellaceae bacterium]|jgi:transketolase|nr:transketolase family protein [Prevotellaceae bacterium]
MIACRKIFTDTLLTLARTDRNIIAVTTDARGSVMLDDFANELPEQFVECGIAEQNAVGISAGLAHSGKKVFTCGPACFYVARSLEQIKVDVAYSRNDVKIIGVSGGVAYGALGASHHSLHDMAVLRTFPGMNIVLPSDARQTKKLVKLLVNYPEAVYVRIGRAPVPDVYENDDFDFTIGKANVLLEGNDLTIIGTGETVYHAYQAGRMLHKKGIKARVLDMASIKPYDRDAILYAARETGRIITVEEHSRFGGLGSLVTETLAESPVPVKIIGIPDENVIHGNSSEIFAYYGLDAAGIFKAALNFIAQKYTDYQFILG